MPRQDDPEFYPVTTMQTDAIAAGDPAGSLPHDAHYGILLSMFDPYGPSPVSRDHYMIGVVEATWYASLQPEYKAWPSIVAALAATKVEIACEHLRMPFPAFAVRLPVGFMAEEGGPQIRCLLVATFRNVQGTGAVPVTSLESTKPASDLVVPFMIGIEQEKDPEVVLFVEIKYVDEDGDDAFAVFTVGLEPGTTLEESFARGAPARRRRRASMKPGQYYPGDRLAHELLSLAVGVSFFATGRTKAQRLVQADPRPRHERRRFSRDEGGEQPTFSVGRDLVLPREEGVPGAPPGGEGTGAQLKWAHYRTGHLRYQPYGPGKSERRLTFIEPTLVRPDLPLRPKVTPSAIKPPEER